MVFSCLSNSVNLHLQYFIFLSLIKVEEVILDVDELVGIVEIVDTTILDGIFKVPGKALVLKNDLDDSNSSRHARSVSRRVVMFHSVRTLDAIKL